MVNEAFIFDALRTPRGKRKNGALNEITPADLAPACRLIVFVQLGWKLLTWQQ